MSNKSEDVAQIEVVEQDGSSSNATSSGSGADDRAILPAIRNAPRGLQPPDFLLHMSVEERHELEAKLKRKIDLRLMPAIILMYILNYIDRWVSPRILPRIVPHGGWIHRLHYPGRTST